ncbi:MAG TPA: FHA domain-containing protein [Gemmatimonadaceae bacterium]|nr:FHA domain-containing protein [Gemmatimonadaceae bacterium]
MPYIQLNDKQFPLRTGSVRVGTTPDAEIKLPGGPASAAGGVHAVVELGSDNQALIRRGQGTAGAVRVNGVQLGAEPTPLIHGDKIEIGGVELTFGDDRRGGSTQFVSSASVADVQRQYASSPAGGGRAPTLATGGRLVSLVDGREYSVGPGGLSIGREAGCEVVVPSGEVSRRHAQISAAADGYVLKDTSTNGVMVNGARIQQQHRLARGDVIRVADEEFRFYADTAAPAPAAGAAGAAGGAAAMGAAAKPDSFGTLPPSGSMPRAGAPPQADRPVLAVLEIVNEGVMKGRKFELRAPLSHVGRGAHNDVSLQDDSVSDSHAKLQKRDAGWFVVDMDSTNGTYVAGKRIVGEQLLTGAPDVRFGGIKMVFRPAAVADDTDTKGTRAIAGMTAEQAQRLRAGMKTPPRAPTPPQSATPARGEPAAPTPFVPVPAVAPETPPAKSGLPAWLWIVAIVLVAVAAFFILKAR